MNGNIIGFKGGTWLFLPGACSDGLSRGATEKVSHRGGNGLLPLERLASACSA